MKVNGAHKLFGYPFSSKYIFVFSRRMKCIQVWNNSR